MHSISSNPPINLSLEEALFQVRTLLKDNYEYKSIQAQSITLLAEILKCEKIAFYKEPQRILSTHEQALLRALLKRLKNKEPIAYILSFQDFWTSRFFVNSDVLIPRVETELLVERALYFLKTYENGLAYKLKVLDLACGSGCLGLSLLKEHLKLHGELWDICPKALAVSRKNSDLLQIRQERLSFYCKDILDPKSWDKLSKYDILISNPPYIAREEESEIGERSQTR